MTFMNLKNARLGLNAKCEMVVFTLIVSDRSICDKQNIVQVAISCCFYASEYMKFHIFELQRIIRRYD